MIPPHVQYDFSRPPIPYMEYVSDGPPLSYMEQVLYGPPQVCMVLYMYYMTHMVLPYLIWNKYLMVPLILYGTGIIWFPHMLSVFMSYMTLMVLPYLIWNRYHMVPQHVCMVPPHVLWLLWIPDLIWNRYLMVSPTCEVSSFMSYMTLMVPPIPYME